MGKVIVGATMSLNGFMNDRKGDVSRLYPDREALRTTEMLQEEIQMTGAVVMGRRSYDMGEGDLTDYEYQVPIFVLTHAVPEKVAKGQNDQLTVTFVTDGIERAIAQAKAAAGDKQVTVVGGANTAQQCLRAGLVDDQAPAIQERLESQMNRAARAWGVHAHSKNQWRYAIS
jgi:dihydrofolate reductase